MDILHRTTSNPPDSKAAKVSIGPLPPNYGSSPTDMPPAVRTWASPGWAIGVGTAVLVFVALGFFIFQNTGTAEFSFLWLQGTLPQAVALLIAAAGAVLLIQLSRLIRHRNC